MAQRPPMESSQTVLPMTVDAEPSLPLNHEIPGSEHGGAVEEYQSARSEDSDGERGDGVVGGPIDSATGIRRRRRSDDEDRSGSFELGSGSYRMDSSRSVPSTDSNANGDGEEDTTKNNDGKDGMLYRAVSRFPKVHNILLSWPRTCSLLLGVLIPLFVLIFLAVVVGIILSIVEAPLEVAANNHVIATDVQTYDGLMLISAPIFAEQSAFLPSVCLDLYLRRQNPSLIEQYVLDVLNSEEKALQALNLTDPFRLNQTSVTTYLQQCGAFAQPLVDKIEKLNETLFSVIGDAMTFNWIRCIPGAKGLRTVAGMASLDMIPYMRYDAQKKHFIALWEEDRKRLYNFFYHELMAQNMSSVNASTLALEKSIKKASGVRGCELNAPASGWWFFTILTTVGYGSYNAESTTGKALVYTVGFICILLFGWILTIAGYLSSAIFDDALVRWQLKRLTWPSLSCLVWGLLFYLWMAVIAATTWEYKVYRVGESDFTMNDAYWFSYVSSTTIGLGDITLDPEVFLYRDLVAFSLLLLVGFVLVAAFIAKLVELVRNVYGQHTLLEEMVGQLKSIDMLNENPKEMAVNAANRVTEEAQKVVEDMKNFGQEVTRESTRLASQALEQMHLHRHENGDGPA